MNEKQNQNKNYLKANDALNPCPECGYPAYELETGCDMHYVGCIHCGLHKAIENSIRAQEEQQVETIKTRARMLWNEHCLNSYCDERMLAALGINHGEYVLVDNRTLCIAHVVPTVKDAKDYILQHAPIVYKIYINIDGILQDPGHTWIIRELFDD